MDVSITKLYFWQHIRRYFCISFFTIVFCGNILSLMGAAPKPEFTPPGRTLSFVMAIDSGPEKYAKVVAQDFGYLDPVGFDFLAALASRSAVVMASYPVFYGIVRQTFGLSISPGFQTLIGLIKRSQTPRPSYFNTLKSLHMPQAWDTDRFFMFYALAGVLARGDEKTERNFFTNYDIFTTAGDESPHCYDMLIFVPKDYTKNKLGKDCIESGDDLHALGLNPERLTRYACPDEYPAPLRGSEEEVADVFGRKTVKIIREVLTPITSPEAEMRFVYWAGHGLPTVIGGVENEYAQRLLRVLSQRANVVDLVTCYSGGIQRERMLEYIDSLHAENMLVITRGITDLLIPSSDLFKNGLSMDADEFMQIVGRYKGAGDDRGLGLLPFFLNIRFDKYFDSLERFFGGRGSVKLASKEYNSLGPILSFVCHDKSRSGSLKSIEVINFFGHRIHVIDLEDKVAILGRVRARVIDSMPAGEKKRFDVNNKNLFVVYPESFWAKIKITGSVPHLVSGLGGKSKHLLASVEYRGQEIDVRAFLRALFVHGESFETLWFDKDYLIENLNLNGVAYHDVYAKFQTREHGKMRQSRYIDIYFSQNGTVTKMEINASFPDFHPNVKQLDGDEDEEIKREIEQFKRDVKAH